MKPLLADASAILAYLNFEPGSDMVAKHLSEIAISSVNLAEIITVLTLSDIKKDWIDSRLKSVFGNILEFTPEHAQLAGSLVAMTKKHGLSLGDRACLATGITMKAKVLTTDTAWKNLDIGVEIILIR